MLAGFLGLSLSRRLPVRRIALAPFNLSLRGKAGGGHVPLRAKLASGAHIELKGKNPAVTGEIENSDIRLPTHVLGHDAAGFVCRTTLGSLSAPRSHNLVAAIGDSTVDQIHLDSTRRIRSVFNHFHIGNALAGNRAMLVGNFGVSGDRTDHALARLEPALASGAGTLYISEGVNNFVIAPYVHAVSGLTIAADAVGASALGDTVVKVDAALALGMKVIVALCHGASNLGTVQIAQLAIYNAGLRRLAELRPNVWILDVPAILRDPSTTPSTLAFRSGYLRSGEPSLVHESATGAYFVGKAFAGILAEAMRAIPRNRADRSSQRSADNRTQLFLNPLFNATSGNAGVLGAGGSLAGGTAAMPYDWSAIRAAGDSTTTFTVGVEPSAGGNGNDLVITYNVTTAGGGVRLFQDLGAASPYWLAGDVLQGFATITIAAGSTGLACARPYIEINGTNGGVNATIMASGLMNDTSHGVLPSTETMVFEDGTEPIAIPVYDSRGYLSLKALGIICATAGTGTVRVSMPSVIVRSTLVA